MAYVMSAEEFMDVVFKKIEHGDEKHRAWLKEVLQDFVPVLRLRDMAVEAKALSERAGVR